MFPIERKKAILELLDRRESVSVEELSKALYTGEATIRRDLDKMAKEGVLTRTHGGAVRLKGGNVDYPYAFRESENAKIKDAIATEAAQFVSDGMTLFLDGSSTAVRLIPKITFKKRLRIITNGVKTAYELSRAGLDTICTGGSLSLASASLTGIETVRSVEKYNVDVFFFSCRAFSIERGITESSEEVAEVKAAMTKRARQNILLADGGKFDKTAFCTLDVLDSLDYVITDISPDSRWRAFLSENGIKVLSA